MKSRAEDNQMSYKEALVVCGGDEGFYANRMPEIQDEDGSENYVYRR